MLRRRLSPLLLVGLVFGVAGCPAEEEPPVGDDDTPDAGPPPNEGGRDPFEVVDGGFDGGTEPPTPCVDDDAEDNDTTETATALVVGETVTARFCGDDDDWYAFDVGGGCTVTAALDQVAPEGGALDPLIDLDIVLVDATSGAVVVTGRGTGPTDTFAIAVPRAGRYAVRVDGNDAADVDYTLLVDTACEDDGLCPADDAAEDNDTALTASTIARGVSQAAVSCGVDDDFYALSTTAGCMTDAQLTFATDRGNLDLELVTKADPAVRKAIAAGTADNERLVRVVDPTTTVARVFHTSATPRPDDIGSSYRIELDQICAADLACPGDDPFENNDTREQAASLEANSEILGRTCGTDEDFFRFAGLGAGCTITVTARFTHSVGDLDMRMFDAAGAELVKSESVDDDESVAHTFVAAGEVTAQVYGYQGAENTYRLVTSTSCP